MGIFINALDVSWSIAFEGYRELTFCKTGGSFRMSCSIIHRSVRKVINNSRSRAVTENEVSSRELHRAPNGLEIITQTCGLGNVVNTLGVER